LNLIFYWKGGPFIRLTKVWLDKLFRINLLIRMILILHNFITRRIFLAFKTCYNQMTHFKCSQKPSKNVLGLNLTGFPFSLCWECCHSNTYQNWKTLKHVFEKLLKWLFWVSKTISTVDDIFILQVLDCNREIFLYLLFISVTRETIFWVRGCWLW
jgi:hypothetical protein